MWEFIAFVLFGLVMFVSSGVMTMIATDRLYVRRGYFYYDDVRYRVVKDEE